MVISDSHPGGCANAKGPKLNLPGCEINWLCTFCYTTSNFSSSFGVTMDHFSSQMKPSRQFRVRNVSLVKLTTYTHLKGETESQPDTDFVTSQIGCETIC